jgi:flagellar basal-body rod protein FlgF
LDPTAGKPNIAEDGAITQGQNRVGVLGLFTLPANAQLTRVEGNAFTSNIPGTPTVDSAANGVVQGFMEQSNVNPMSELTRLIYVQRSFDGVSTTLRETESSLKSALQTLGVS